MAKHEWRKDTNNLWVYCRVCLVIQRIDGKNSPCKGRVRITTRGLG